MLKLVLATVLAYLELLSGVAVATRQPAIMSKVPSVALMTMPFERLWVSARAGRLNVDDPAPDFTLQSPDRRSDTRLSSFRGHQPVALIFDGYAWPPFRREVPALNSLYEKYKTQSVVSGRLHPRGTPK
jgi:hypothetical protein